MAEMLEGDRQALRRDTFNHNVQPITDAVAGAASTAVDAAVRHSIPGAGADYLRDSVDAVRGAAQDGALPAAAIALRRMNPLSVAAGTFGTVVDRAVEAVAPAAKAAAGFGNMVMTGDTAGTDKPKLPGTLASPEPNNLVPQKGATSTLKKPADGGVMPTATPPAQSLSGPMTAYQSTNPSSSYDDDIEFTHVLSRLYGMAGRGDKSMAMRDMYQRLNQARITEVGTNAQRAFIAGDITAGINMFNHMVPNGRQITGYRVNGAGKDKTYSFQYADGAEETYNPEQLSTGLMAWSNPALIGEAFKARTKAVAEATAGLNKDVAVAQFKHGLKLDELLNQTRLDMSKQVALKQLDAQFRESKFTPLPDMSGVMMSTPQGDYKVTFRDEEDKLTGKKVSKPVLTPVAAPRVGGAPSAPGAAAPGGGYAFDVGAIRSLMGQ